MGYLFLQIVLSVPQAAINLKLFLLKNDCVIRVYNSRNISEELIWNHLVTAVFEKVY